MGDQGVWGQVEHGGSRKIFSIGLVVLIASMSLAIAVPSMSAFLVRTESAPVDLDFAYEPSNPNTGTIVNLTGIATDPDGDDLSYEARVVLTDYQATPVPSGPVAIVAEEAYSLFLMPGWNLICLPLLGDYRASTLGLPHGDVVVGPWNPIIRSYSGTYIVGISPPISDFNIVPGLGYWIFATVAQTLHLQGIMPTGSVTFNITVPPGGGWALMGFLGLKTHHASQVPLYYSGGVSAVAKLQLPFHVYLTYIVGVPPTDFAIYPGEAFFMYCNSSGTFSYPP